MSFILPTALVISLAALGSGCGSDDNIYVDVTAEAEFNPLVGRNLDAVTDSLLANGWVGRVVPGGVETRMVDNPGYAFLDDLGATRSQIYAKMERTISSTLTQLNYENVYIQIDEERRCVGFYSWISVGPPSWFGEH